jgi:predicted RNase H-like nuclease (RuvC/YqgF family)
LLSGDQAEFLPEIERRLDAQDERLDKLEANQETLVRIIDEMKKEQSRISKQNGRINERLTSWALRLQTILKGQPVELESRDE